MSGLSSELLAKMNRQGYRMDAGTTHAVPREQPPADEVNTFRSSAREQPPADEVNINTFRSGWSRPPRVAPPRNFSPAGSQCSSCSGGATPSARAPSVDREGSTPHQADSAPIRGRVALVSQALGCTSAMLNASLPGLPLRGRARSNVSHGSCSDRDREMSVASNASSLQIPMVLTAGSSSIQGLHHEGWLSKRTSHKLAGGVAARWQSRYWTLEGCTLRYHKQRGAPVLRSFDLRRVRQIEMPQSQPRELELNFGFRIWRLRAESPEAARRWFLLLDAARLVAGEPLADDQVDDMANCSDDDSADSTRSTSQGSRSDMSVDPAPRTPATPSVEGQSTSTSPRGNVSSDGLHSGSSAKLTRAQGLVQQLLPRKPVADPPVVKAPELLSASAVADRLEVDPDDLDRRFDAWLGSRGSSATDGTPHFGDNGGATSLKVGLEEAFAGMWTAIGGKGPDGALAAWLKPQMPEPQAFAEASDGVLCEYLSRMQRRLEHWVVESDPVAEEIEDVSVWFLFDARKALDQFELRSCTELHSKPSPAWRALADELEMFLLGEWETRSCDEICKRVEVAYTVCGVADNFVGAVTDTFALGGSESTDRPRADARSRVNIVLELLRVTLQGEVWQGHPAACDRSMSVLIAALNAVLRFYRSYARALLGLPSSSVGPTLSGRSSAEDAATGRNAGRAKSKFGKMLNRISKTCMEERASASTPASCTAAFEAAADADLLATFCREAQIGQSRTPLANATACTDVVLAFAGAFEREGSHLCAFIAEAYFSEAHRHTLKEISFSSSRRETTQQSGSLAGAVEVARGFLDAMLTCPSAAGGAQVCDAVIRIIVQYWVRAFRRGPPRLSVTTTKNLTAGFDADEAMLRRLAARFGTEAIWARLPSSDEPLQVLREVRQMLSDQSPEAISLGAERLEVVLGVERGAAVARSVRSVIAR